MKNKNEWVWQRQNCGTLSGWLVLVCIQLPLYTSVPDTDVQLQITQNSEFIWWAATWQSKGQVLVRGSLNTQFAYAAFVQHQFKSQNQHHPILPYSFPGGSCVKHLHWQYWQCICVVASIREAVLVWLVCSSNSAYCSTFPGNTTHSLHLLQSRGWHLHKVTYLKQRQNTIFRHLIQNLDTLIATL